MTHLVRVILALSLSSASLSQTKLLPDDGGPNEYFGWSVSLSGDMPLSARAKMTTSARHQGLRMSSFVISQHGPRRRNYCPRTAAPMITSEMRLRSPIPLQW